MYVLRILAPLACVLGVACNSDSEVTMPCPRPAFTLFPQLDTIAVGATLQYETMFPSKYPPAEPGALVCEPLKAAERWR
jgi:hypothetical protein